MAELQAIQRSLQMIFNNTRLQTRPRLPIHIFTDCQYARNVLLSTTAKKKNFLLIDNIKDLASKLRYDLDMPVYIHWIPSHIEKTIYGIRPIIGNQKADKHAEDARNMSTDEDTCNQTSVIRAHIFKKVTTLLRRIDHLLHPDNVPPTPFLDGPSHDDFDVQIDASQEFSQNSCDT